MPTLGRKLRPRFYGRTVPSQARLQLSVLAYDLGNLWRRLVLPKNIDAWSLTRGPWVDKAAHAGIKAEIPDKPRG
jgi:hypothetical protein